MAILVNKIRCKHCGDIIESKYTHNWVQCSCGRCYVDGGHSYLRRGFVLPDDYEDMSVTTKDDGDE